MDERSWSDQIVGDRMAVDREFTPKVQESRFSSQEWSLVMTATRFEIENPDDPEAARIVVDDEHVKEVLPEVKALRSEVSGLQAPPIDGKESEDPAKHSDGSVLGSIKRKFSRGLGLGGGKRFATMKEERQAAATLTQEYADQLQARLESNGRWDEIRSMAAEEAERPDES